VSTPIGFVGREPELRVLDEQLAIAAIGQPRFVFLEGEAGAGKSTLLAQFLNSHSDSAVVSVGGDEAETLLAYGVVDQMLPGSPTDPGTDPMAVGARLLDLFDRLQADGQLLTLVIDDLQWIDRRREHFCLRCGVCA
jgi:type II secretory pathway predicted ATPase ExeA